MICFQFPKKKSGCIFELINNFRTADNIVRLKNCLKDFEAMQKAQDWVNQKARKDAHYFEHINFTV